MRRNALAVAAICGLAAAGVAGQGPPFEAASPIAVGPGSGPIALVDIDGDGHLDILTSHLPSRRIGILLGDGRGGFRPPASGAVELAFAPGAMAHGDVDRDGRVDIVLASRDDENEYIHVLRGNGRGGFDAAGASRYRVGEVFRFYKPAIVVADVTGDGVLDIVTANGRRNRIDILIGDGGGFTRGPVVTTEGGGDFHSFALGDVDGDRYPDLVTTRDAADGTGWLAVRRGDASAGFTERVADIQVLPRPYVAAVGDTDGDRQADLVLRHAELNRVSVLVNGGGGRFTQAAGSPFALETEAFAVLVRDIDRDGVADLLAATVNSRRQPYEGTLTALIGTPRRPAAGSPFTTAPGAYQLAIGDVDEDGRLDVVASSFEGTTAALLRGR